MKTSRLNTTLHGGTWEALFLSLPQKSLTLFDVKAISSGMYQCHCTNEIGNAQATFAVQVKGMYKLYFYYYDYFTFRS